MKRGLPFALLSILTIISFVLAGCKAVSGTPESGPSVITAENINQLNIVDRIGQGDVYGVALSPDESTLAVSTSSGVYLYDKKTMELIEFIDLPFFREPFGARSNNIAYSPDGKFLALAYDKILIWDIQKKKIENIFKKRLPDSQIMEITYSPSGNALLVMSEGQYSGCDAPSVAYQFYGINFIENPYSSTFCGHIFYHKAYFLTNGNLVIFGYQGDGTEKSKIILIDSDSGNVLSEKIVDFGNPALDFFDLVTMSTDGSRIAEPSRRDSQFTEIVDAKTNQVLWESKGVAIYIPGDESILLLAGPEGASVINDNFKTVCTFPNGFHYDFFFGSPYGRMYGYQLPVWDSWDNIITIWDFSNCKKINDLRVPIIGDDFAINSDNSLLAAHDMASIYVWNINLKELVFQDESQIDSFTDIALIFDRTVNDSLYVNGYGINNEDLVKISDITKTQQIETLKTNMDYPINILQNEDGTFLGINDSRLMSFLSLESNQVVNLYDKEHCDFAFIRGNTTAGILCKDKYEVFNYVTNETVDEYAISKANLLSPSAFSFDGSLFAFQTSSSIEIWSSNGEKLMDLVDYSPLLPLADEYDKENEYGTSDYNDYYSDKYGYLEYEQFLFSPLNKIFIAELSGNTTNLLRIWDLESNKVIRDILLPFDISDMHFSPDGTTLYTSSNGLIYVWQIVDSE